MATSSEPTILKKRGRPRKTVDAEVVSEAEKGTRSASTKAAGVVKKGKDKDTEKEKKVVKSAVKKVKAQAAGKTQPKPTTPLPPAPTPILKKTAINQPKKQQPSPSPSPQSSKILRAVTASGTFKPHSHSTPPPPPPQHSIPKPFPPPPPTAPSPPTQPFPPTAPLSSLPISPQETAYIHNGQLPPKYRGAGRRVTAIIISIPVLLVTSWELYQRFALGVEGKKLVRLPEGETEGKGVRDLWK
jgi:hypothetical protein